MVSQSCQVARVHMFILAVLPIVVRDGSGHEVANVLCKASISKPSYCHCDKLEEYMETCVCGFDAELWPST
jgi:hypothetical protein